MKRIKTIETIVVLATIILIGLVTTQYILIKNSRAIREEQFRQNVNQALETTALKLEKLKAVERFKAFENNKFLLDITHSNSLITSRKDSGNTYITVIQDSIIVNKANDSIKVYKRIIKHLEQNGTEFDSFSIEEVVYPYDSINELLRNKTNLIAKFLHELIEINVGIEFIEKFDEKLFDSLIVAEMSSQGIDIPFSYGVFDKNNNPIFGVYDNKENIISSGLTAKLFPYKVFGKQYFVKVSFKDDLLNSYLQHKNYNVFLIAGILILTLTGIFYYTIYLSFKQKKLARIKDDFVNNMTHELKTPISTISIICESLDKANEKIPQELNEFIDIIKDENNRLKELVEKVMQKNLENIKVLSFKDTNINELINRAVSSMSIKLNESNGKINLNLDENLKNIYADEFYLTNSFINLLDNAIKYSNDVPKIKIKTKQENNGVKIEITDKGIGIKKSNIKYIFERFYREPKGNIHDVKGFGLGLFYVKKTIDAHGGTISVKSEYGKGSVFDIFIPT